MVKEGKKMAKKYKYSLLNNKSVSSVNFQKVGKEIFSKYQPFKQIWKIISRVNKKCLMHILFLSLYSMCVEVTVYEQMEYMARAN